MSGIWLIIGVLLAGVGIWLVVLYRRDRRRERARVRDVLSPALAREIARERAAADARKAQFAGALKQVEEEHRK